MIIKNITSLTGMQMPSSSWISEKAYRAWGIGRGAQGAGQPAGGILVKRTGP